MARRRQLEITVVSLALAQLSLGESVFADEQSTASGTTTKLVFPTMPNKATAEAVGKALDAALLKLWGGTPGKSSVGAPSSDAAAGEPATESTVSERTTRDKDGVSDKGTGGVVGSKSRNNGSGKPSSESVNDGASADQSSGATKSVNDASLNKTANKAVSKSAAESSTDKSNAGTTPHGGDGAAGTSTDKATAAALGKALDGELLKLWDGVPGEPPSSSTEMSAAESSTLEVAAKTPETVSESGKSESSHAGEDKPVVRKMAESVKAPLQPEREAMNLGRELDRALLPGFKYKPPPMSPAMAAAVMTSVRATLPKAKQSAGAKPATGKTSAKRNTRAPKAPPEEHAESPFDLDAVLKALKHEQSLIDLRGMGELITEGTKSVTNYPADESLRLRLGSYFLLAGDYEGAAIEMRKAIMLKPQDYRARLLMGKIYDDLGEYDSAGVEHRRAIDLASNTPQTHCAYADSLLSRGDVSPAINEYRRAIAAKPTAEALTGLAESLIAAHDKIGSLKAARQAVALDPSSARAHVVLTKALLLNGNDTASMRTAKEAVLLGPSLAASHLALGRCLHATGDLDGAIEEFKQAVTLEPLSAQARNDLGYALYSKGDMLAAVSEFRIALRLNPHLGEARNNLEVAIHGLAHVAP